MTVDKVIYPDENLIDRLKNLDESSKNVNQWEASFIESVAYQGDGVLTDKQREAADRILQKYGF